MLKPKMQFQNKKSSFKTKMQFLNEKCHFETKKQYFLKHAILKQKLLF